MTPQVWGSEFPRAENLSILARLVRTEYLDWIVIAPEKHHGCNSWLLSEAP